LIPTIGGVALGAALLLAPPPDGAEVAASGLLYVVVPVLFEFAALLLFPQPAQRAATANKSKTAKNFLIGLFPFN